MSAGPSPSPAQRAPVTGRSRFCRLASCPYTEVDGRPLVLRLDRRAAYEIALGAMALWAALDGRPLHVAAAGAGSGGSGLPFDDAVEVVRRWRALGLVEERAVLSATGQEAVDGGDEPREVPARVSFHARASPSGASLVVGEVPTRQIDPASSTVVTVELTTPSVVGASRPLADLLWPDERVSVAEPLDPVEVFAGLLSCVTDDDLHHPGLADALADLAERLRGRRAPRPAR